MRLKPQCFEVVVVVVVNIIIVTFGVMAPTIVHIGLEYFWRWKKNPTVDFKVKKAMSVIYLELMRSSSSD